MNMNWTYLDSRYLGPTYLESIDLSLQLPEATIIIDGLCSHEYWLLIMLSTVFVKGLACLSRLGFIDVDSFNFLSATNFFRQRTKMY